MGEEKVVKKNSRGRPLGFKLSEETKDKIREKRIGRAHSEETKEKISRSLAAYFKSKDPLTDSLENDYRYFPEEANEWISDNSLSINDIGDVFTNKRLTYVGQQVEICYGEFIQNFSHNVTPEFLVLLKEELCKLGRTNELDTLFNII